MEISNQLKRYRKKHGIPLDKPVKGAGVLRQIYCWNDKCLTGKQWAERLGICGAAFETRLRVHGKNSFRTFLTKSASMELQRIEHAFPGRDKSDRANRGNEECRALGDC